MPSPRGSGDLTRPAFDTWVIPVVEGGDAATVAHALRERVKELNCLYAITHLAEGFSGDLDRILDEVVNLLPRAWQFPDICQARIILKSSTHRSPGFSPTPWSISSAITMYGETAGEVTVAYSQERPPAFEGPFLREERTLLEAVAERIGAMATHVAAERELQESNRQLTLERRSLQEANTALRAVLARIEEEKREIRQEVRANVERILLPILQELALVIPKSQRRIIELLRDSLEEITSPFVSRLSAGFRSLTPTEIRICHMIRGGLRTKEIAQVRGISPATVNRHRERIRRKLGLTNEEANLATFLQASLETGPGLDPGRSGTG
jgi:DNA-binding CsgD family transcriptional regulator